MSRIVDTEQLALRPILSLDRYIVDTVTIGLYNRNHFANDPSGYIQPETIQVTTRAGETFDLRVIDFPFGGGSERMRCVEISKGYFVSLGNLDLFISVAPIELRFESKDEFQLITEDDGATVQNPAEYWMAEGAGTPGYDPFIYVLPSLSIEEVNLHQNVLWVIDYDGLPSGRVFHPLVSGWGSRLSDVLEERCRPMGILTVRAWLNHLGFENLNDGFYLDGGKAPMALDVAERAEALKQNFVPVRPGAVQNIVAVKYKLGASSRYLHDPNQRIRETGNEVEYLWQSGTTPPTVEDLDFQEDPYVYMNGKELIIDRLLQKGIPATAGDDFKDAVTALEVSEAAGKFEELVHEGELVDYLYLPREGDQYRLTVRYVLQNDLTPYGPQPKPVSYGYLSSPAGAIRYNGYNVSIGGARYREETVSICPTGQETNVPMGDHLIAHIGADRRVTVYPLDEKDVMEYHISGCCRCF